MRNMSISTHQTTVKSATHCVSKISILFLVLKGGAAGLPAVHGEQHSSAWAPGETSRVKALQPVCNVAWETSHYTALCERQVNTMSVEAVVSDAVYIGSRLELLVDRHLLQSVAGGAGLRLHQPVRREIVFETEAPWEGNACGYASLVRAENTWRIYYHTLHYRHSGPPAQALEEHPPYLCYIESDDGLHWQRPEVGLFMVAGSRANNIVLVPEAVEAFGGDPAHTAVLYDENPDCPPQERYKVVILGSKPKGLFVLGSGDGQRFTPLSATPAITEGAFDSQNLMFWDPVRGEYREYHREFADGIRGIMTSTSADPLHFPPPQWLAYPGAPIEQLYTNQVMPYPRAPHLFIGFPARYVEREQEDPLYALPGLEERLARAKSHPRYGTTVTDTVFMSSRDGLSFNRWPEAFIRPGPRERESWVYGDNYTCWGLLETPSVTEDAPPELSLYASDGYWEGTSVSFRRYSLRLDGFVSVNAPLSGGEIVTRPLIFDGGNLALNVETSAAGGVQVEVQDANGRPIEGYTLADCPAICCDRIGHIVRWKGNGGDLRPLAGKPVRLRFSLNDADLYAFRFLPYTPAPVHERIQG